MSAKMVLKGTTLYFNLPQQISLNKSTIKDIILNLLSLPIEVIKFWLKYEISVKINGMYHNTRYISEVCNILTGQINPFGLQRATCIPLCHIQQ
jgi:hypothetical protein